MDAEVFVARGLCLQHQTALAKGPGATILDITPGLFGITKHFSSGMHTQFKGAAFCLLDAFGMDQGLFLLLLFVSYLFQTSCRYDSCIRLLHVIVLRFRGLYVHQETDQPDWRPEPEDVSYAEWVLDVTYYQRLEASARRLAEAGVEEPHKLRADIERKKTHGRALVAASQEIGARRWQCIGVAAITLAGRVRMPWGWSGV